MGSKKKMPAAICHLLTNVSHKKFCGNNRGFAGGADGQRSDDHGWNGFTDDADAQSKVMGIPRIVEGYDIPGQFMGNLSRGYLKR